MNYRGSTITLRVAALSVALLLALAVPVLAQDTYPPVCDEATMDCDTDEPTEELTDEPTTGVADEPTEEPTTDVTEPTEEPTTGVAEETETPAPTPTATSTEVIAAGPTQPEETGVLPDSPQPALAQAQAGQLPNTGAEASTLALLSTLLLLAGGVLVLASRGPHQGNKRF